MTSKPAIRITARSYLNRHPSDRLRQAAQIVSCSLEYVDPKTRLALRAALALVVEVAEELEGEDVAQLNRDPEGVLAAARKRMRRVG